MKSVSLYSIDLYDVGIHTKPIVLFKLQKKVLSSKSIPLKMGESIVHFTNQLNGDMTKLSHAPEFLSWENKECLISLRILYFHILITIFINWCSFHLGPFPASVRYCSSWLRCSDRSVPCCRCLPPRDSSSKSWSCLCSTMLIRTQLASVPFVLKS